MDKVSKTVLITGASSGIGRQTAYIFAKANYKLVITYNTNQPEGKEVKSKCLELGAPEVELLHLDLTQEQGIEDFARLVNEKFQKIDIVINNAGYLVRGKLSEQTTEDIERQLKTNLLGLIKLTKLLLPNIKETIINIGSTLSFIAKGNLSIYCTTKFGLRGFTKSLALESPDLKIFLVNPSATATPMGPADGVNPKRVAEIIYNTAIGEYNIKSGAEINYVDYQYGKYLGRIVGFLRKVKNIKKL